MNTTQPPATKVQRMRELCDLLDELFETPRRVKK